MRVLVLLLLLLLPGVARAMDAVDVALVLVSDVSRSVDAREFELQKRAAAAALTDPHVLAAIRGGTLGAVAVAYVEFAGATQVETVLDWRVLRGADDARAFAAALEEAPRAFAGRTSISAAIDHAARMLADLPFEVERRVIDVSGDGTNNSGREAAAARDDAVAAGIVVNGLAILDEGEGNWITAHVQPPGGLGRWYSENIAGGPGSFVVEVTGFESFGEAMARKLVNEIAALPLPARL